MNNIKYEEDSEDIDFPPIKFTSDIIYVDKNPKKDFCSKYKKFCNQKKILIFLSICILLFIILMIILIVCLTKKKNKPMEEKNDKLPISNTQYKGGFITLKFRMQGNEENITIFNNDKINITNDNYNISYSNNNINNNKNLRYLDKHDENNIEIKENILIIKKQNINISQYEFVINFNNNLSTMEEMFKDNQNLLNVDLSNLKSDQIKSLKSAFYNIKIFKFILI